MEEFNKKIEELKGKIYSSLEHIITSDYVLLDLPYHDNIGDVLIWEGEESFLRTLPHKCLFKSSKQTFKYRQVSKEVVVLIHGGGNFGDLWREMQEFHIEIVKLYPENPIIFLPQTVHYEDKMNLLSDSEELAKHNNLIICARDNNSYEILKKNFKNNILQVPDMAFCINYKKLRKRISIDKDIFFLKRTDREVSRSIDYSEIIKKEGDIITGDWPTMDNDFVIQTMLFKLRSPRNPVPIITDRYANYIYRPYVIKLGVDLLSSFKYVYTTRLHGAILCILLGIPFSFINNSYGKNSSFYHSWLSDCKEIEFIS